MIRPLNIDKKVDNDAKLAQIIKENIPASEFISADEFNALIGKINEMVPAINVSSGGFQGTLSVNEKRVDPGFYFPTESGTFINAGNVVVDLSKGINFVTYDGVKWDVAVVPIVADGKVEEGNVGFVSGGEVFDAIKPIDSVLFDVTEAKTNFISELVGSDVNNTDLWGVGFFNATGSINTSSLNFRYAKKFYTINGDLLDWNFGVYGDAAILFYDKDYNLITGLKKGSTNTSTYYKVEGFKRPVGAVYFKPSHFVTNFSTSNIYIKNSERIINPKSDFFLETSKTEEKVGDILKNYKVETISQGTEFISELINSDLSNSELWVSGFYVNSGRTQSASNWVRTKKKYRLPKGAYRIDINVNGNAVGLILNLDGTVRQVLAAQVGGYKHTFLVSLDQDADFVTSNPTEENVSFTSRLSVKNLQTIYSEIVTSLNFNSLLPPSAKSTIRNIYKDKYRPRKKRPVITIISDDGRIQNDEWFIPMLNDFGVKSTFAIVGNWTREADLGIRKNVFNSKRLRELYLDGHDIASHTWTHTSDWGTVLTLEQIEEEMSRSKVFLERITTTPVNMFISPYGIRNATLDNIISKYYDANFISWNDYSNQLPLDNYYIKRCSFDGSETEYSLLWESKLKSAIDNAIENNVWLIFAIHPQYTQYYTSNPNYMARRNELRILLQYCQDKGIEVTTAKKGYEYFKNFVNIGVRGFDNKVYQLGMDGSEFNMNYFEE